MKFIFLVILLFSLLGSRIGSSGISDSLIRSLHYIDLLTLPCAIYCIKFFFKIRLILGGNLKSTLLSWLSYSFLFSAILNPLLFYFEGFAYFPISFFFWIKELQVIIFFLFTIIFANQYAEFAKRAIHLGFLVLSLWFIKELFLPSGLYFLGLPFEAGPSQSGIIYALLFTISIDAIYDKNSVLFYEDKILRSYPYLNFVKFILPIFLFFGCIASASRTAIISIIFSSIAFVFFSLKEVLVKIKISYIGLFFTFLTLFLFQYIIQSDFVEVGTLNRFSTAFVNIIDRTEKWQSLLSRQILESYTMLFGFGFNSPNQIVLGKEFGNILAVDNGYVRRIFETGLFGFIVYTLVLLSILLRSLKFGIFKLPFLLITTFSFSNLFIESVQTTQTIILLNIGLGCMIGIGAIRYLNLNFQNK